MDVHLALEKRLGQRRALIGRILLGGQKNNLAVKPLFAQGRRGLNPGVAGADDDDRGQGMASSFNPQRRGTLILSAPRNESSLDAIVI